MNRPSRKRKATSRLSHSLLTGSTPWGSFSDNLINEHFITQVQMSISEALAAEEQKTALPRKQKSGARKPLKRSAGPNTKTEKKKKCKLKCKSVTVSSR